MVELTLVHLYPDLMNLYGDQGNIIALQKRCAWRGIQLHVVKVSLGDAFPSDTADMVFIGGGQDYEQSILQEDVLTLKKDALIAAIENNIVFLAICGGFQLLGEYYETADGKRIACLGALDHYTVAGKKRLIGNLVFQGTVFQGAVFKGADSNSKDSSYLIGFENHSGKTYLGPSLQPLGKVLYGHGNNGEDGFEGVVYKNTFGSYGHGSLLPKNPAFTDLLITRALKRKYPDYEGLAPLPDTFETKAREGLLRRFLKL